MKKALLVISFGTSYEETRKRTLDEIERTLAEAFPDRALYRAWTSGRILKKLRANGNAACDTLLEALERMARDGVTDVLAKPTLLLAGYELQMSADLLREWRPRFERIALRAPLLVGSEDLETLTKILERRYADTVAAGEMLAFMGHGSEQTAFNVYSILESNFRRDGYARFCVGTVEFDPGFAHVLAEVRTQKPRKVWLAPMMVVAGDHATNDMAGEEDDSWKNMLGREGTETVCVMQGMGEYPEIRDMYVAHARAAAEI